MTYLQQEIESSLHFLAGFDEDKVRDFISKIKPPVLVAAMGSSYYLPTGRAQSVADKLGVSSEIRFIFASEGYNIEPKHYESLVLISNSGQTREIIAMAKKFSPDKIHTITSSPKSDLGKISKNLYVLQSGKEKAVAATKSIVEQSVVLESLVRSLASQGQLTRAELKPVREAMKNNISHDFDQKLLVLLSGAKTIYFAGGTGGVGEEVALKFNELAKIKSKYIPGTQILHGPEEVIEKGDVVFLTFADKYKDYFDRFAQMKEKTGCYLFMIGAKSKIADFDLDIDLVPGFKPYCILAYFWNILTKFAMVKGFSLDKGDKISKVGVQSKKVGN